jgi:chemotaxis family two-component system response regulator Rcp1
MSTPETQRSVEILLVEDDPADEQLVQEALKESRIPVSLNVVEDGDEALAYLHGEGRFDGVILPDLILLDLKMPKKSGLELLAEIKSAGPELRRIPVIVLTTSDAPADILQAYDLQASAYITKPSDLDEFDRVMDSIKDFCLTVVRLPPRE